jgi:two-component system, chemotaxis family, protein-glutamate methylesterase/glutaminase
MVKQRVLVVDDSPLIRRMIRDFVRHEFDLEVVGEAENGKRALELCLELKPDVITLDIEMPICDGLTALQNIMEQCPTPVLMCSSLTSQGAKETLKALELGAYDFVTKPGGSSSIRFVSSEEEILTKIRAARYAKIRRATAPSTQAMAPRSAVTDRMIVIASSTGGPQALVKLWPQWPSGLQVPVLMVQHMPQGFTASLAKRLNSMGTLSCREAVHGEEPVPGMALLAPGGQHMRLDARGKIELFDGPTLHGVKPAADHLFETVATKFGKKAVALVLTGMGKDAAQGAVKINECGGFVIGEAESTCTIYGMPKAAKDLGAVSGEYAINEIGHAAIALLGGKKSHAA